MGGKEPAEMTVAVLRRELKKRKLETVGLKAVLVERLERAMGAGAKRSKAGGKPDACKVSISPAFERRLDEGYYDAMLKDDDEEEEEEDPENPPLDAFSMMIIRKNFPGFKGTHTKEWRAYEASPMYRADIEAKNARDRADGTLVD